MFVMGAFIGVIMPANYIVIFTIIVLFTLIFRYLRFDKSQVIPTIYVTILVLFLTAGMLRAGFVRNYNLSEINPFVGEEIQLCGEIVGIEQYEDSTSLDVKAFWVESNNQRKEVNAKIRLRIYKSYDNFKLRDVITANGRLDKLPQMQFWGYISKRSVYGAKGIFAVVNSGANSVKIIGHNSIKLDFLNMGFVAREKICKVIDSRLPNDEGALLKGILVGDKSDFTEEMDNNLKLSGLSHIAAVSGVNISIFLIFIAYMINHFGIKRRVNAVIMLIATVIFMVVIGDQPTVLRAGVMMLFTIFMVNLKLRNDMLSSLFFATLVLAMVNPYLTHDIGFQLSFLAVLGLILYVDKIGSNVFLASISVFIVIIPVLAYYFNVVTFASLFSNVLIAPLLLIVLPIGYLVWLIPYFATMLYPLLKIMLFISEFFASIKFLTVPVASPTIPVLVIYAVLLYILYEWLRSSENLKSKKVLMSFLIIIAVITNLGYNIIVNKNTVDVNFISVGNANAIHIRTSKGLNILIDSGLARSKVRLYLIKKGVSKIDLLFVTNYSTEHIGGAFDLVENFKVDRLMLPQVKNDSKEFEMSLKNPNNTEITYYDGADNIKIDDSTSLKILMHDKYAKVPKNASAVVQLHFYNTRIMLPSDIDTDVEGEVQSDILLLPNHGTESETSEEFINAVKPKYSVISTGKPQTEAMIYMLSTYTLGTISFKIGKNGINSINTTRFGEE